MDQRAHIRQRLEAALAMHPEIAFAYLHGSFLDQDLPFHDVDLAVYLNPDWAVERDLFEYEMALSVALTLTLHITIDVHVLNQAGLGFQHSVLSHGEPFFSRDDERLTAFIEQVGLDYIAFSHHAEDYMREVMR